MAAKTDVALEIVRVDHKSGSGSYIVRARKDARPGLRLTLYGPATLSECQRFVDACLGGS